MNGNKAVETGKKQKDSFQSSLSEGFRSKIKKGSCDNENTKRNKGKKFWKYITLQYFSQGYCT